MEFLSGIVGFFRWHRLTFVKKVQLDGDIAEFYFKPHRPFRHVAGQHAVFFVPILFGIRIFSIASAPEEPYVMIATHVRAKSRYKRYLDSMKKGQVITTLGPILFFFFRKRRTDYVFLAQGIGITPFRSLLVHAKRRKLDVHITLVHVARPPHTFRDETETMASESHFVETPEEFTVLATKATANKNNLYFLSGSPRFVTSTKKLLRQSGVKASAIKSDNFLGY